MCIKGLWAAIAIALGVVFLGCTPKQVERKDPRSCEDVSADLSVCLINVACGPGMVPDVSERCDPGIDLLATKDCDVVVLNEAWLPEYRSRAVEVFGVDNKNVAYLETVHDSVGNRIGESGQDKCTEDQLVDLDLCAASSCGGVDDEDLRFCIEKNCIAEIGAIKKGEGGDHCVSCLVAMAGNSIGKTKSVCTTTGRSRIQGGNNGVMVLSRLPLEGIDYRMLDSSGSNRVAVYATIALPDGSKVDLVAVHLAASNDLLAPMHSGYETWGKEKSGTDKATREPAERKADQRNHALLYVGDLNSGLQIVKGRYNMDDAGGVLATVMEAGYDSYLFKTEPPVCSANCPDNKTDPTVDSGDMGGKLIDHILLRQPKEGEAPIEPVCADAIMTELLSLEQEGMSRVLSYSDHYGVRIKYRLRGNQPQSQGQVEINLQ